MIIGVCTVIIQFPGDLDFDFEFDGPGFHSSSLETNVKHIILILKWNEKLIKNKPML